MGALVRIIAGRNSSLVTTAFVLATLPPGKGFAHHLPQPEMDAAIAADRRAPSVEQSHFLAAPLVYVNLAELPQAMNAPPADELPLEVPFPPLPENPPSQVKFIPKTEVPIPGDEGGVATHIPPPASAAGFVALGDDNTRIPPDVAGAVGPHHVLTMLNSQVRFQTRTGYELLTYPLFSFWNNYPPPFTLSDVFDPRIVYDPFCGRWYASAAANRAAASSSVLFAVSQTNDPTGVWGFYRFDIDAADTTWADYPTLGFSANWVVIQVNRHNNAGNAFVDSVVYALDKPTMCSGAVTTATAFTLAGWGGTQVPSLDYDNAANAHHLLQAWSAPAGQLRAYPITGTPAAPVLNTAASVVIGAGQSWSQRPLNGVDFSPQMGSAVLVQVNDDRMHSVVRRNGSLWGVHQIFLPQGGNPTQSSIQWWQINTAPLGTILQRALISDPTGAIDYAFPSLAVNANKDILFGYSEFSATQFPSAGYSYRAGTDTLNTVRTLSPLKAGLATYNKPGPTGLNRWGDYTTAVVDPFDNLGLWTIQEYAELPSGGFDRWGTWWSRFGDACAPAMVWAQLPAGPSQFGAPAMAYDSQRQLTVLFGGLSEGTWEWNGATWIPRSPTTSPSNRNGAAMAYDAARGRTVLFGGFQAPNDTWEWNGTNWAQILTGGAGSPPPRRVHGMAYDAIRGVTVLFGGFDDGTVTVYGDTWEWNGSTWTQRNPASAPSARTDFAMAYDPIRGVTVLHGGGVDETWEWNGTNWTQRFPPTTPGARQTHKMVYDAKRGACVMYGGNSWPTDTDTWEWDGTNWKRKADSAPGMQVNPVVAYDLARGQTVLVGDTCTNCLNSATWVFPGQSTSSAYCLTGNSNATGWSWCINAPGTSVCNLMTAGVGNGLPASAIAAQFVQSVNAAGCQGVSAGVVYNAPQCFYVTVGGTQAFNMCTGAFNTQPSCCQPGPACMFNPTIVQVDLSGTDCDGNLTDDAVDIAAGTLADLDGNGIPDVCDCTPGVYGDVHPVGNGNGVVDLDDILCVLDAFANPLNCPGADIAPCESNGVVNLDDILAILDAFSGNFACPPPCD